MEALGCVSLKATSCPLPSVGSSITPHNYRHPGHTAGQPPSVTLCGENGNSYGLTLNYLMMLVAYCRATASTSAGKKLLLTESLN